MSEILIYLYFGFGLLMYIIFLYMNFTQWIKEDDFWEVWFLNPVYFFLMLVPLGTLLFVVLGIFELIKGLHLKMGGKL